MHLILVPRLYFIQATDGSYAVAVAALFTAKVARCIPESAFGFVCRYRHCSRCGRRWGRDHGDPSGVFIATREPSNGTRLCSGRKPLVPMMEPADLWKRHNLSAAGLN